MEKNATNYPALTSLVTVFFFWGFIASGNSIFIPFCKRIFALDQFQSQLIDFAFYFAYFLGAFAIFLHLQIRKIHIVAFWGYKKSIVLGLLISAVGSIIMSLAVLQHTFLGLLIGLFVLAAGFSLQQIAAQPLAISLGPAATGAHRINLGGAVNSFGTMIAPILISLALFGSAYTRIPDTELSTIDLEKMLGLYTGVFFLFLIAAAFIHYNKKIPASKTIYKEPPAPKAMWVLTIMTALTCYLFFEILMTYQQTSTPILSNESELSELWKIELSRFFYLIGVLCVIVGGLLFVAWNTSRTSRSSSSRLLAQWGAMRHQQIVWGMLAIFFYVGVEVSIVSNLGELLTNPQFGNYSVSDVSPFLSLYWGSLMIGRWSAALAVFRMSKKWRNLLQITAPIFNFLLILLFNWQGQDNEKLSVLGNYFWLVLAFIFIFFLSQNKPRRTLIVFSSFGLIMMIIGLWSTGIVSIYAFLAGGLACSILWPAIFSLSLAKLGKDTAQGSAFLIMMILGGAVLPPIQGKLADLWGIHFSFILPAICFTYLLGFGFFIKNILNRLNVNYDQ